MPGLFPDLAGGAGMGSDGRQTGAAPSLNEETDICSGLTVGI